MKALDMLLAWAVTVLAALIAHTAGDDGFPAVLFAIAAASWAWGSIFLAAAAEDEE